MTLTGQDPRAGVGIHAGWAVTFHREREPHLEEKAFLTVTSRDHDAEIDAVLASRLEGGGYTIVVEGLADPDVRAISGPGVAMRLYLYWQDTTSGTGAYLANVAGRLGDAAPVPHDRLVAELSVTSVSRRVGRRLYETVIVARERVHERLRRRVGQGSCFDSPKAAIQSAARATGITLEFHHPFDTDEQLPASVGSDVASAASTFAPSSTYAEEIGEVASAIEDATRRHGRGVLLIRDGTLHVGVRAPGKPVPLTPETGVVEVIPGVALAEPGASRRARHSVVLKGRPDLKPGDLVAVDLPVKDDAKATPDLGTAIAGAFAGPLLPGQAPTRSCLVYVDSVSHRLGSATGFATTVAGVEVGGTGLDDVYDPPPPGGPRRRASEAAAGADPAARAARAVQNGIQDAISALRLAESGEVRGSVSIGDGSADDPPRHTATVWRGHVGTDGHPNRLARRPIERTHPEIRERVPRVTPFAWGRTGLVVPRYPGTRVLLGHGGGASDDPVDLGAMWETGAGPDAKAGDWWLILPVGVPRNARSSVADDAHLEPHTGSVTQDLIDADGNRVIEVGELTIRVTRDALADAGARPKRGDDADAVTIEHVEGRSRIVMTSDGTIRMEGKRIELDVGSQGTIAMTAGDVQVSVQNAMDVT